jgi:hypothetical protein
MRSGTSPIYMGFLLVHYTGLDCFRPIHWTSPTESIISEGGYYTPARSAVTPSRTPPEGNGPAH